MTAPSSTLRLGTRGSLLARTQSQIVANALEQAHPDVHVELVTVKTSGDQIADRPLYELGGKGLFTRELEQALLAGEIDFAVHSFKDVPVTMPLVDPSGLLVAAVPAREDVRDVLVSEVARDLGQLPHAARVGTGSLRRRCQLLAARPDLVIEMVRGNIDTRLRKLREGQFAAIVLAAAGINRASLFDNAFMTLIDVQAMLPAPGQGALSLQCRRDDAATRDRLVSLNDTDAAECVDAERALVAALEGDCHSPIAALATISGDRMELTAAVGARDGTPPVLRAAADGPRGDRIALVGAVFASLEAQGVHELLHPKS